MNNLKQLGLALANYESGNGVYPYGMARENCGSELLCFSERLLCRQQHVRPAASVL